MTPAAQQVVTAVNQLGYRLLELQLGDKLELTENRVFSPVLAMQQLLKWGQTRPMAEQVILSESLELGNLSLAESDKILSQLVKRVIGLDTAHQWQVPLMNSDSDMSSFELGWEPGSSFKHPLLVNVFNKSDGTKTQPILQVYNYLDGQINESNSVYRIFLPKTSSEPIFNFTLYEVPSTNLLSSDFRKYLKSAAQNIRENLFDAENYLVLQRKYIPFLTSMRIRMPRFNLTQNLDLGAYLSKLTQNRLSMTGVEILQHSSIILDPPGSIDWFSKIQAERLMDGPVIITHRVEDAFAFQIFQPDTGLYLMMGVLANPELASLPPAVLPTTSP